MANTKNPVLKNVETGQIIEVFTSPFTIGRSLSSDYIIENKIVSRIHCILTKNEEGWTLTDSSTNGTLVNDGHYKNETSPILKHNDEISLGIQSYTYKFLTEAAAVANYQIEKLKNEEIHGNTSATNDVLNSGPNTPNSFEDNGISDEMLNNLADDMLISVEQENICTQPHTQENNIFNCRETASSTSQTNQENVQNQDLEQPITSTVIECGTVNPEQPESHNRIYGQSDLERGSTSPVPDPVNIISDMEIESTELDPQKSEFDGNSQSQANSSTSTLVYSLPDEIPLEILPSFTHYEIARTSAPQVSKNQAVMVENVSSSGISETPKPRNHLDEAIEAVVQGYSKNTPSNRTKNTTDPLTYGISMDPGPSTSSTHLVPTTVSLASPINTNKKIKMTHLKPTNGQGFSAFSVRDGQEAPKLRKLANSEMQRILANQPQLPILRLDNFPPTNRGLGSLGLNRTGIHNVRAKRTYRNNRVPETLFRNIANTSVNTENRWALPGYSESLLTANSLLDLLRRTASGNTLLQNAEDHTAATSSTTGVSVITSGNALLENSEDYVNSVLASANPVLQNAVITSNSGNSNLDVIDSLPVPPALHEVVIESIGDVGENTINTNKNQIAPSVKHHDYQKPSTSKSAEHTGSNNNKQSNQNQFEEMENELMCTICANLFIKAVTLGCSHSFCEYCIQAWKKKKTECPICRNKIVSTTRTLVLDNIIEKMLENASEQDKQDRNAAVEERKKIEEAETAKKKQQNANKNSGRGAPRGRRGRGNINRRGNWMTNREFNNRPPVITIGDSPSTTDNDSDDSEHSVFELSGDEWYNGTPGAYYGGYGRCYHCGEAGHWSNGCPYR